jgi:hypothetical protein
MRRSGASHHRTRHTQAVSSVNVGWLRSGRVFGDDARVTPLANASRVEVDEDPALVTWTPLVDLVESSDLDVVGQRG